MITQMYVIFDSKAQCYNKPFSLLNDEVALRAATDLRNSPDTEPNRHPEDFSMFHIGSYDDTTAHFKPADIQNCIIRFHEIPLARSTSEASTETVYKDEQLKEA